MWLRKEGKVTYPVTGDTGLVTCGTLTAGAFPTTFTDTLAHVTATPVCKQDESNNNEDF